MRLVVIESPYAGNVETNLVYLRACMFDCLRRGEAPYASHALYTQAGVLDDDKPEERALGIEAGFAWCQVAHVVAFYLDLGRSPGMNAAWSRHATEGRTIESRWLGPDWRKQP